MSYFVGEGRYKRGITVFPWISARRLFKISAKRIGVYGKRALNRGGRLLSSPVGNQAYLSYIIQFTHRVIIKEAIETGFPCIPRIKKWSGRGGEGSTYSREAHVWYFGLRGGCLLEGGRLFEEVRYTKKIIQFLKQNPNQPSLYRKLHRP